MPHLHALSVCQLTDSWETRHLLICKRDPSAMPRPDGNPFEQYEPGAHIDVTGPSGVTR